MTRSARTHLLPFKDAFSTAAIFTSPIFVLNNGGEQGGQIVIVYQLYGLMDDELRL
jgi:hypothetical protein